MAVGGIVAVLVISAAFYAIGRGEDRERTEPPDDAAPLPPRVPGAPGTAGYQAQPPGHAAAEAPADGGDPATERPGKPAGPAADAGRHDPGAAPSAKRRPSPPPGTSRRRRP